MSMTFKQIQDAVIADAFTETDRANVKVWINTRGAMLWGLDEWAFTKASALVTVTAGSGAVTNMPTDFSTVLDLFRDDGTKLKAYEEYREFANIYLGTNNSSVGVPEAYTVLGEQSLIVGPLSSVASGNYLLAYENAWTDLVNDADVPALPPDCHLALVHGAKSEGFTLKSILLADPFEKMWQSYIETMGRTHLTALRGAQHQTPPYRPGGYGIFS